MRRLLLLVCLAIGPCSVWADNEGVGFISPIGGYYQAWRSNG